MRVDATLEYGPERSPEERRSAAEDARALMDLGAEAYRAGEFRAANALFARAAEIRGYQAAIYQISDTISLITGKGAGGVILIASPRLLACDRMESLLSIGDLPAVRSAGQEPAAEGFHVQVLPMIEGPSIRQSLKATSRRRSHGAPVSAHPGDSWSVDDMLPADGEGLILGRRMTEAEIDAGRQATWMWIRAKVVDLPRPAK